METTPRNDNIDVNKMMALTESTIATQNFIVSNAPTIKSNPIYVGMNLDGLFYFGYYDVSESYDENVVIITSVSDIIDILRILM